MHLLLASALPKSVQAAARIEQEVGVIVDSLMGEVVSEINQEAYEIVDSVVEELIGIAEADMFALLQLGGGKEANSLEAFQEDTNAFPGNSGSQALRLPSVVPQSSLQVQMDVPLSTFSVVIRKLSL